MKKTSVYLSEQDRERLRRIAEREGVSQATVLREAIAAYDAVRRPREFAMTARFAGDGRGIRPLPEDEFLKGFGGDGDSRPGRRGPEPPQRTYTPVSEDEGVSSSVAPRTARRRVPRNPQP